MPMTRLMASWFGDRTDAPPGADAPALWSRRSRIGGGRLRGAPGPAPPDCATVPGAKARAIRSRVVEPDDAAAPGPFTSADG